MSRIIVAALTVLALSATGACGRRTVRSGVASADTTVRGVVRIVGSEPLTTVVLRLNDEGPGIAIVGSLSAEIGSLSGVEVAARGAAVDHHPPTPPRAVDVRSYDVVAVGDLPARSGRVAIHSEALWLVGVRDSVELAPPVPEPLRSLAGHRVYVAGPLERGRLHVQAFGAIKE
jgi:hypothetical protein